MTILNDLLNRVIICVIRVVPIRWLFRCFRDIREKGRPIGKKITMVPYFLFCTLRRYLRTVQQSFVARRQVTLLPFSFRIFTNIFFRQHPTFFTTHVATPLKFALAFSYLKYSSSIVTPPAAHDVATIRSHWCWVTWTTSGTEGSCSDNWWLELSLHKVTCQVTKTVTRALNPPSNPIKPHSNTLSSIPPNHNIYSLTSQSCLPCPIYYSPNKP